jgi:hypothetical protein
MHDADARGCQSNREDAERTDEATFQEGGGGHARGVGVTMVSGSQNVRGGMMSTPTATHTWWHPPGLRPAP